MANMRDVSLVLGMGVTRDREKGTVTITQDKCTKSVLERCGMARCNSTYTPGVGKELSLDQPEERLLSKEEKQRFQAIKGSAMYLGQVSRYDILYAVNHLARAMSTNRPKLTWRQSNIYFATWPGRRISPLRTSKVISS